MFYDIVVSGNLFEASLFGPPSAPGVYIISVMNPRNKSRKVMYVGSSCNILKRLSNMAHPYRVLMEKYTHLIVATEFFETDKYIELEKEAIRQLTPPLNKRNGTKRSTIPPSLH